jgi:hypothetical protein
MTARGGLLLVVAVLVPAVANADRHERYVTLGYSPGQGQYKYPLKGSGPKASAYSHGLDLAGYYGLTNSVHVGARLRTSWSTDVHFSGVSLPLQDGSVSHGELYVDHHGYGVGALVLYRVDTRSPVAPVLELEGGVASHRYSRIVHVPTGVTYTLPQSDVSTSGLYGAAALQLEYRFATRWTASVGVRVEGEKGGYAPWLISVPLRAGYIW